MKIQKYPLLSLLALAGCASIAHAKVITYDLTLGGDGKASIELTGNQQNNVWQWSLTKFALDKVPGWNVSSIESFQTGSGADPLIGLSLVSSTDVFAVPRLRIDDDVDPASYDGVLSYYLLLASSAGDSVFTGAVVARTLENEQPLPEPATLALLGLGLGGLLWARRGNI